MLPIKLIRFFLDQKRSALLFIVAGILNTATYFFVFLLFWRFLGINHIVAVTISYIISAIIYFFLNRNFTFKANTMDFKYQTVKYLIILLINYIVTIIIIQSLMTFALSPLPGLIIASITSSIIGYLAFKYWVFSTPKVQTQN